MDQLSSVHPKVSFLKELKSPHFQEELGSCLRMTTASSQLLRNKEAHLTGLGLMEYKEG